MNKILDFPCGEMKIEVHCEGDMTRLIWMPQLGMEIGRVPNLNGLWIMRNSVRFLMGWNE